MALTYITNGKIVLPDSLLYVGDWAFFGCGNITSITLPDSVEEIGYGAFYACKAEITYEGTVEEWNAIEKGVNYFDTAWFYHDGKSENIIGELLNKYDRDSFYIADKIQYF